VVLPNQDGIGAVGDVTGTQWMGGRQEKVAEGLKAPVTLAVWRSAVVRISVTMVLAARRRVGERPVR